MRISVTSRKVNMRQPRWVQRTQWCTESCFPCSYKILKVMYIYQWVQIYFLLIMVFTHWKSNIPLIQRHNTGDKYGYYITYSQEFYSAAEILNYAVVHNSPVRLHSIKSMKPFSLARLFHPETWIGWRVGSPTLYSGGHRFKFRSLDKPHTVMFFSFSRQKSRYQLQSGHGHFILHSFQGSTHQSPFSAEVLRA